MSTSPTAVRSRLLELLEPVIRAGGYDVEDVTVTPAGRRRLVRVVVDRDGGLTLDDVAEVATAVSAALDDGDALGETPYVLEVTSPGVDRPLREPRHWRRAVGRLVTVPMPNAGPVTGRVVSADDGEVVLDVGGAQRRLPYSTLGPGGVQVEFDRHDEPQSDGPDADLEPA